MLGKYKLAALAAIGLVIGFTAGADAQTRLRLAVETTGRDPTNVMLGAFRDELQAAAGDEVAIEYFEGGALGDENALAELIRAGQVEVVSMGSDIVALDSKFAVFDMPFLLKDKATARAAMDGELGTLLAESLRETVNLEVLGYGELGFRVISNNVKPIAKPEDLKGLKLRTPSNEGRIVAFSALGAAPTPMPLGEAYVALRQGALDGQENPLSVIKEFSLFEVQKYISITNHVYTPIILTMNGSAWDALSPELQAKLKDAARKAGEKTRQLSDESDTKLIDEFKAAGVEINTIDPAAFQAAAEPVAEKLANIVTPEFMNKALEIVK
ncbi:TRAP transporter substrate-binding protein [Aquamicrobium terrae]|uniref:Tripartite ATP-independent transporter DctP family solute receptor n=1 Tax=Aquamicrobium terrae TaxID=1324945 RepID=A0ABV2N0E3_9HYPH